VAVHHTYQASLITCNFYSYQRSFQSVPEARQSDNDDRGLTSRNNEQTANLKQQREVTAPLRNAINKYTHANISK